MMYDYTVSNADEGTTNHRNFNGAHIRMCWLLNRGFKPVKVSGFGRSLEVSEPISAIEIYRRLKLGEGE